MFAGLFVVVAAAEKVLLTPELIGAVQAFRARAAGIHVSLWAYCRAGIPITLATLALGAWWLS